MRVRSKGLGRIELLFDIEKLNYSEENGHLVITGKTLRPVVWDFRIAISENEVPSLVKVAFRKPVRLLVTRFLKNAILLKRKETTERKELVHKDAFK